jgi:hypothetical protein
MVGYLIGRSGMSPLETALLVLKQEGGIIIYVSLALVTLFVCLFPSDKSGYDQRPLHYLKSIYVLLIVSLIAAVAALVGPFGGLDIYRFARFLVPWATLTIGSIPLLGALVGRRGNWLYLLLTTCALVVAAVGGAWALHPSPYVFEPNDQVTAQDIACMEWISQQGDGRPVMGIWNLERLAQIAVGYSASRSLSGTQQSLPEHFGYDQFPRVRTALPGPAYLLITEHDRASVLGLWSSANKYTEEDFRRLEMDPSVALLYLNGQCKVWATHP